MKITAPDEVSMPESVSDKIIKLIEAEFEKDLTMDKLTNDVRPRKTIRIAGYYEVQDCRDVVGTYLRAGWDSVNHRRDPYASSPTTTFTFFKKR